MHRKTVRYDLHVGVRTPTRYFSRNAMVLDNLLYEIPEIGPYAGQETLHQALRDTLKEANDAKERL